MRIALIALALLLCSTAAAGGDTPLERIDYVRCMSHVERASQAAMLRQNFREDSAKALQCDARNTGTLTQEQLEAFVGVYQLLAVQLEAPSATVHGQVVGAAQRFLQMID